MRADRFKRIWPELKPNLYKVARFVLGKQHLEVDIDDLVQEAAMAVKRCKTTKKKPHRLSYLIMRGKYRMWKIVKMAVRHASREIPSGLHPERDTKR